MPAKIDQDGVDVGCPGCRYLTLFKHILRDFILQCLGRLLLLQNFVLSQGQKTFEDILAQREAEDESLPRETRSVEEVGQTLFQCQWVQVDLEENREVGTNTGEVAQHLQE